MFCKHENLKFVENIYGDRIHHYSTGKKIYRSIWKCEKCGCEILKEKLYDLKIKTFTFHADEIGNISDGYHTFNELYYHRAVLFSVICNQNPLCSWKAKKHHDGTMYDEMFIVGINTPEGQATYHYDIEPYWNMFHVPETELAPEWDGHTPDDAIRRIGLLGLDN